MSVNKILVHIFKALKLTGMPKYFKRQGPNLTTKHNRILFCNNVVSSYQENFAFQIINLETRHYFKEI